MRSSLATGLAGLISLSAAQSTLAIPTDLVGTWSTKSNKTHTGPGFYDPLNEELIEPERTGISYSFTSDGHYEEAYYRAIANPQDPSCPKGIMQWQHGTFTFNANGSLTLTPFAVDGRQLMSDPCAGNNGVYTRYNTTELFERYESFIDPYHNIQRLNLYKFDGSPVNPMFIAFSSPQMLPTTTLNPTVATATATGKAKSKRELDLNAAEVPVNWKMGFEGKDTQHVVQHINADRLWWIGLALTGAGGLLYMGPRRMGIHL